MGKRGPAPTPTPILKARGSWRGKIKRGEPAPPVVAPACPDWLPDGARVEWGRLAGQLEALGVLAEVDRDALVAYCMAWSEYCELEKEIQKTGLIIRTGKKPAANPLVKLRDRAAERALRLAIQFGLTPSARSRVQVQKKEEAPSDKVRFFKPA